MERVSGCRRFLLRPGRNVIDMNDRSSGPYLLRLADGTCLRVVKD